MDLICWACRSTGAKCFDRVPHGIAFKLAERQGIHPRVLQLLRDMYRELRRRVAMAGHVVKDFAPSKGIIQGSPLSEVLLNLLRKKTWV